ncbi:MAG: TetR/AcrR family transcriptional regulator [Pseudomonadota bacterium]
MRQINRSKPKPDGRETRRVATRDRLILAAKSVMADTSVNAVTVDGIVQKAGVGKGSFYNHFNSKEDLFFATLDEVFADMADQIMSAIEAVDDPAEELAIGIRMYVRLAAADPEIGRLIINAPASFDILHTYADPVVNHTIDKGLQAERFKLRDRDLFFLLLTSGVNATLSRVLEQTFDEAVTKELAASALLLAGIDSKEALEIASKSLPTL